VKRHWNEHRFTFATGNKTLHEVRDRLGSRRPPAIFELQHHLARNLAVSDRRPKAIVRWRRSKAAAAFCVIAAVEFEWQPAATAAGLR
jgi:hypothetical protein